MLISFNFRGLLGTFWPLQMIFCDFGKAVFWSSANWGCKLSVDDYDSMLKNVELDLGRFMAALETYSHGFSHVWLEKQKLQMGCKREKNKYSFNRVVCLIVKWVFFMASPYLIYFDQGVQYFLMVPIDNTVDRESCWNYI